MITVCYEHFANSFITSPFLILNTENSFQNFITVYRNH